MSTPFVFDALLQQRLLVLFFAALVGASISLLAAKKGYYQIPTQAYAKRSITWMHVLGAFVVFICMELIIVPSLYLLWLSVEQGTLVVSSNIHLNVESQGWINMIAIAGTWIALCIYFLLLNQNDRDQIFGEGIAHDNRWNALSNFLLGAITWVIVYPWIVALGQFIEIIQQFGYHGPHIDQVVVKHLKDAFAHPYLLWTTFAIVVTIVPFLEELLFRGFLQTWLKGLYGISKSIIITSVIFASFHFSFSQGIENIELLISLFLLSCYLGFIRERQNSLWASIGLHSTFNTISLFMLFLE